MKAREIMSACCRLVIITVHKYLHSSIRPEVANSDFIHVPKAYIQFSCSFRGKLYGLENALEESSCTDCVVMEADVL